MPSAFVPALQTDTSRGLTYPSWIGDRTGGCPFPSLAVWRSHRGASWGLQRGTCYASRKTLYGLSRSPPHPRAAGNVVSERSTQRGMELAENGVNVSASRELIATWLLRRCNPVHEGLRRLPVASLEQTRGAARALELGDFCWIELVRLIGLLPALLTAAHKQL